MYICNLPLSLLPSLSQSCGLRGCRREADCLGVENHSDSHKVQSARFSVYQLPMVTTRDVKGDHLWLGRQDTSLGLELTMYMINFGTSFYYFHALNYQQTTLLATYAQTAQPRPQASLCVLQLLRVMTSVKGSKVITCNNCTRMHAERRLGTRLQTALTWTYI